MKIDFIFRKKMPHNNSIEELFDNIIENLKSKKLDVEKSELPYSGASIKTICKNLNNIPKKNPDTVYHITGDVHYVALALKGPSILTVHDIRSALTGNFIKNLPIKILWFWMPALLVKKITVISQFSKDELSKVIPFAKQKIIVIPNPTNRQIEYLPKSFDSHCPRILHLGTKANKNLEGTILALKDVNCHLSIIGELNETQKKLLAIHKIDYSNIFHVAFDAVVEEYKKSDLVCFVSFYEGFGMPIIESQKTGRPVITSNAASMPEVAGEGACLVDPHDIQEIRAAILKIINDEEYREELVKKGLKNVKRFEIDHIVSQYLDVYKSVLGK